MKTLEQALMDGRHQLAQANIEEAQLDAWYLMEHCFHVSRAAYYMDSGKQVSPEDYKNYMDLIKQRSKRIPLQHLTNSREFYGYEFYVNEHVLIPRQETEVLVEEVVRFAKDQDVLDICTGSGCIIITIAKEAKPHSATALDISEEALCVARKNAEALEADITFIQSDLFEKLEGTYDIIVSNPPYIRSKDIEELEPEVRLHEPMLALDGFEDGLYFYRKIIEGAKIYLRREGRIFFEIGYDQGEDVKNLLQNAGFSDIKVIKDLTGRDRIVTGIYS